MTTYLWRPAWGTWPWSWSSSLWRSPSSWRSKCRGWWSPALPSPSGTWSPGQAAAQIYHIRAWHTCIGHEYKIPIPHRKLQWKYWLTCPMLVTNVQRHSRDSSSVWISSFLIHSCMIFPVSILILYNSPIKRMLPSDLLRSFISCAWTNRRSVLCQLDQSNVSIMQLDKLEV